MRASMEYLIRRRGELVVHLYVTAAIPRRPEGPGERNLGIRQDPFPFHGTRGFDIEDGELDEVCYGSQREEWCPPVNQGGDITELECLRVKEVD